MPKATGLVLSTLIFRVDPGHQNSLVDFPATALRILRPKRSMAKLLAPPSVSMVPPFSINSRRTVTPSAPIPVRYSGGRGMRPKPPPPSLPTAPLPPLDPTGETAAGAGPPPVALALLGSAALACAPP